MKKLFFCGITWAFETNSIDDPQKKILIFWLLICVQGWGGDNTLYLDKKKVGKYWKGS